ncbi:MAG: polysaccharide biosynthesis tyrosine autokinase [Duncaniella sp.]|nr:polysaccharide biosynthesis tyrosine autokinase [Duncaniella sp.]
MAETTRLQARKNVNAGGVPLTDILYRTLHYWPWVLLSVFICVGIGVIYLLRTPNVYTQSASILIKDESKGKSLGADEFADFGLFQSNTNIQNEVTTLKSSTLMEEVVRRLNLDVNYFTKGTFHDNVAYGTEVPVEISFVDIADGESATCNLNVDNGQFTISDLKKNEQDYDQTFTGAIGDTISVPFGKLAVVKSPYYNGTEKASFIVTKTPVNAATVSYSSRLNVAIGNDKGTVIELTITDQSIQRADAVLNTIIGVYNENWIHDKNQIAISTSNFITERLGVIENELGHVDSDISSYKSANLIPDVEAASSMYMAQNQQASQDILNLNNQLQMTRYIRSYLSADGNMNQVLPINTGVDNVDIQAQITEYNDKILQRNNLISKSSDKNPLVISLDEQLASLRNAIIASVDNSIVALNTKIKNLQGARAATTSKIASNPTQAKYLLSVERQQKVKESLYLFLLQKREENELSQAFTAYNTKVVERPGGSTIPTFPKKGNILMISFLLGVAIPFGIIYFKESNNTKVRGRKDIEHLAIPFLGELPKHTSPKKGESDVNTFVVESGKRDIINEAFRVLRTNVEFMCNSTEGHSVIAMTSFNPGSGKSFVSMNLGMAIALKGKSVLIVDGDMRHGSTSSYLGSPAKGLSDYLSGAVTDISPLIVATPECAGLKVLPVGSMPPNPTELLESPRFGELIDRLKQEYDYVIIDCPPIEVVADAQIIDKFADRTFFVIRAGLLERSMLPELDRLYEEKKYRNMSFILNGTRNDQGRYGYSHTYRYGYGYGYGYGYNYGDKKKGKK